MNKENIYMITEETYEATVNERILLYGMIRQMAFLTKRAETMEDFFHLKETAAIFGSQAEELFETWDIPGRYVVYGDPGDLDGINKMETAQILKPAVNKETGLGTGRVMSHFVFDELPHYHKLLVTTDGGMMTYPTLEQKAQIIENTVETLKALGYENPKIAAVAAVEKVNPKMPETVEARELKEMNERGEIKDCVVEGPISLDIALDKECADIKGFESPVAGDADVILVPNIQVGNILGKSITIIAKGNMAGFVVGAQVPIVFCSRGSSAKEKFLSLALAAAVSAGKNK